MKGKKRIGKKGKKKHIIKMETKISLGAEKAEFNLDKKRAAIKAALHAATAGLAATTSGLAAQAIRFEDEDGDGGLPPGGAPPPPPWGEVIVGPVWAEGHPQRAEVLFQAAELHFWE